LLFVPLISSAHQRFAKKKLLIKLPLLAVQIGLDIAAGPKEVLNKVTEQVSKLTQADGFARF
jgi:hypothetical protein